MQTIDPKTGVETPVVVTEDDGMRADTSMESLGKLKTIFKKDGSTTAGNASQVSQAEPSRGAMLRGQRRAPCRNGICQVSKWALVMRTRAYFLLAKSCRMCL